VKWLILVLALVAVAFWLGARWSAGRAPETVAFRPVSDLPAGIRESIDRDLAAGLHIRAVKTYRDATESCLRVAKAAIDVHRRNGSR
jgi:hypothetical protein